MKNGLIAFLNTIDLFKQLTDEELKPLIPLFEVKKYPAKMRVIQQGESGEIFYILRFGFANVTKSPSVAADMKKDQQEVFITTFGPGDYFGEAALFHHVKRIANVSVSENGEAELLLLKKDAFHHYLSINPIATNKILMEMLKRIFFRLDKTNTELQFERRDALAQQAIDQLLS